ncbi:RPM1-interacting protein 4-like [Lycium barbarum]|uniref:RPM1-interacting protein 4-like n=1 Tax=Lycium barbarum TaxID=112863 RepID=UPI00293F4DA9|nr:RPM1-interacting protein 4-like [Lycium barbarum]
MVDLNLLKIEALLFSTLEIILLQQGSHVPKFGNWDGENVPYTAYFENARKVNKGGKMINPNDPEENPEAFAYGRYDDASVNVSPAKVPSFETPQYNYGHRRNPSGSGQNKSIGSTNSNSESFGVTQRHRKSDVKKNKNDRGNGFVPPSPNRLIKSSRNPSDDLSCSSAASVPKFGAWDEKDPKSGEGFTVIFNKVKEEKHIAASKFPMVQPHSSMPSSHNQKRNAKSKVFCCLF